MSTKADTVVSFINDCLAQESILPSVTCSSHKGLSITYIISCLCQSVQYFISTEEFQLGFRTLQIPTHPGAVKLIGHSPVYIVGNETAQNEKMSSVLYKSTFRLGSVHFIFFPQSFITRTTKKGFHKKETGYLDKNTN